ncbi:MAG: glycosyltransferase family protein [Candidatus Omnitrophica bacterium]|nr:glycosyltransferase family protein [Candidatus Omnitrophota bacterium]
MPSHKVVGIIQARMGSSRFPGKTLYPVNGQPMLSWMLTRVAQARRLDHWLVATTDQVADEAIVSYCQDHRVPVFRGHELDVLDRYYRAARDAGAGVVVRLTADCPLIDPRVIDQVIETFQLGTSDYVSNVTPLPSSFPDGMDVEVFSMAALNRAWRDAVKPSDREHVTFYMWQHPETFQLYRVEHEPDWSRYRLTVDSPQDLEVIEAIMKAFSPQHLTTSMEELIAYLDQHEELRRRNHGIARDAGWQAAYQRDREMGF